MGKTNAEHCKNYYNRKKAAKEAEKFRQGLSVKKQIKKTAAERARAYRLRKIMLSQTTSSVVIMVSKEDFEPIDDINTKITDEINCEAVEMMDINYPLGDNTDVVKRVRTRCAVCFKLASTTIKVKIKESTSHRLCSNTCLAAFKFANQINLDQCGWCKIYFKCGISLNYLTNGHSRFCSRPCFIKFSRHSGDLMMCHCRGKVHDFDLIPRVKPDGRTVMVCSLKCWSKPSHISVTAKKVKCETCKVMSAAFRLIVSEGVVKYFCTYYCLWCFKEKNPNLVNSPSEEEFKTVQRDAPLRTYSRKDNNKYQVLTKMCKKIRVNLTPVDKTVAWKTHSQENSIDIKRSGLLDEMGGPLGNRPKSILISDSESDDEIIATLKNKITVPDQNQAHISNNAQNETMNEFKTVKKYRCKAKLKREYKGLSEGFWKNKNNVRLLKLCTPVLVRLGERVNPRPDRVVKKVELAEIDEVRRINRTILTAQVSPITVRSQENKTLTAAPNIEPPVSTISDLGEINTQDKITASGLTRELHRLQSDIAKQTNIVQAMVVASIIDQCKARKEISNLEPDITPGETAKDNQKPNEDSNVTVDDVIILDADEDNDQEGKVFKKDIHKGITMAPEPIITPKKNENVKSITSNSKDLKVLDDLDEILKSTIITKPSITMWEVLPEADEQTKLFLVNAGESLIVNDTESTPIITGVSSLARTGTVENKTNNVNVTANQPTHNTNVVPSQNTPHLILIPYVEGTVQLPTQSRNIIKMVKSNITHPLSTIQKQIKLPVSMIPMQKRHGTPTNLPINATASKSSVSHNELASLTLLMSKTPTSSFSFIPTTNTVTTQTCKRSIIVPTLNVAETPEVRASVPIRLPTLVPITSQLTPMAPPANEPASSLLYHRLQEMPLSQPYTVKPLHSNYNVTQSSRKKFVKPEKPQWAHHDRVKPALALLSNENMTVKQYLLKYKNSFILRLDSSKSLWTVAEDYILLTEKLLPSDLPTYWCSKNCAQIIWPREDQTKQVHKKPNNGPNQGNTDLTKVFVSAVNKETCSNDSKKVFETAPSSNTEVIDPNRGQKPSSMIKVKSFAKVDYMEPKQTSETEGIQDIIQQHNKYFKKITDDPLVYASMLSVVTSTEECDALFRERSTMFVLRRNSCRMEMLHVEEVPAVPSRPNALLVRHTDNDFLKDMACKFQQLNSANALLRENQVYVFAPKTGTMLVKPGEYAPDEEIIGP